MEKNELMPPIPPLHPALKACREALRVLEDWGPVGEFVDTDPLDEAKGILRKALEAEPHAPAMMFGGSNDAAAVRVGHNGYRMDQALEVDGLRKVMA